MSRIGEEALLRPGVSRELARHRAGRYRDVRYKLSVELAPGAETLKGSLEIRVTLLLGADDLILDWRQAPSKDGRPRARACGTWR